MLALETWKQLVGMDQSHKTRSTRVFSCSVQLHRHVAPPFFSLYRLPHKQWCELLLTCNVEILFNVTRTKTNGMGEQQCALDTMDLCSVHGRLSSLLRCRPVPRGA